MLDSFFAAQERLILICSPSQTAPPAHVGGPRRAVGTRLATVRHRAVRDCRSRSDRCGRPSPRTGRDRTQSTVPGRTVRWHRPPACIRYGSN
eukprot:757061-Hanusia_phi.AAC.1